MKIKKALIAMLCCAMTAATFTACLGDGEDSKKPIGQNPSTQNPSTQNPSTPVTPVVKTVTAEQWEQIFAAMPATNNVTMNARLSEIVDGQAQERVSVLFKLAGNRMYRSGVNSSYTDEEYYANLAGKDYLYEKDQNGDWQPTAVEAVNYNMSESWTGIMEACSICEPIYSQMQYDTTTGVYFSNNIEYQGDTLFVSVEFANGRLNTIIIRYEDGMKLEQETYTFSDYGTTKITLPDEEEEGGGEDSGVTENNCYVFTVYDEYGNYASGYQLLITYGESCLPPLTTDEYGQVYFYPEKYGYGPAEYDVYWLNDQGETEYIVTTSAEYDYYSLWISVDSDEDGGDDEVVVDPEAEAAWNEAFKNTLSSTDFTVECEQNTPDGEGYGMYQVDDGCRAYDRTQYGYSETGEEEYNETYYERVGSYDYVYEYDYDANEYVYGETTVDDEVYTINAPCGNLLSMMQGMLNVMEYQGNDFFLMNEDYMNASFKVFDQMDRVEVVLMDGYVNALRFYGYDADGNECYITYIFYNYGETEIYLPEVAENGTVTEGNDDITNY
ncbi:MAG: hypothetical protein IJX49_01415 [Clostridia bacterium]|nr:hypothetical protein [Clostridia bacterium]